MVDTSAECVDFYRVTAFDVKSMVSLEVKSAAGAGKN
jgi:hypothetical protein